MRNLIALMLLSTMFVTCRGFGSTFVVFDGTTNFTVTGTNDTAYGSGFEKPAGIDTNNVWLVWPTNSNGYGYPATINAAEAWWVGPVAIETGETFSVYGENLQLGSTDTFFYIVDHGFVTNSGGNKYKADFVMPALSTGTHTGYVHNGKGGKYGWSKPVTFSVWAGEGWSNDTGTWVTVAGTDDSDISAAVSSAGSGGTVYFTNGTYLIDNHLQFGNKVRFVGESQAGVVIQNSTDYWTGDVGYPILKFANSAGVAFSNLTLEVQSPGFTNGIGTTPVYDFQNSDHVSFHNVSIIQTNANANTETMKIDGCSDITFENCRFEINRPINFFNATDGVVLRNSEFYGIKDANTLFGGLSASHDKFCVESNYISHLTGVSTNTGDGWGKGRFIAMGLGGGDYFYYSGNVITNYQPRKVGTVDQNSGEMLLFEHGTAGGTFGRLTPVSSTTTSILFSATESGNGIIVVEGTGFGQWADVGSWDGTNLLLATELNVALDTSSRVAFGNWFSHGVVYDNYFDATDPSYYTAGAAIKLYAGAYRWIFDNNDVSDLREGAAVWSYSWDADHTPTCYVSPTYFVQLRNSTFDGCYTGFRTDYRFEAGQNVGSGDPALMAIVWENNVYTNNTDYYGSNVYGGNGQSSTNFVHTIHMDEYATITNITESGSGTIYPQVYIRSPE